MMTHSTPITSIFKMMMSLSSLILLFFLFCLNICPLLVAMCFYREHLEHSDYGHHYKTCHDHAHVHAHVHICGMILHSLRRIQFHSLRGMIYICLDVNWGFFNQKLIICSVTKSYEINLEYFLNFCSRYCCYRSKFEAWK